MSCGWCGYICVKRAGCRTDSDCGFSRVIGCTGAPPLDSPPYGRTGHAFERGNDEMSGANGEVGPE